MLCSNKPVKNSFMIFNSAGCTDIWNLSSHSGNCSHPLQESLELLLKKKIISSQNLFDSWYNIGECELADTILILKLLELLNLCSTLYTLNIIWLKSIGNKIANFILHHNSVPLKGKHFSKEMAMVTVNLGCFLRTLYLHVFYFSEYWQTTVDSVLYELFSVDVYHQKHELNLIKVRESKDKMMANLHGFFFLFK